ncbi:hypothetical protein B296_00054205 [Ensete ventricosum]|uniref:Uncharacterized protein n=1 Tax=Ensete ventricosum TaxID=4639 RepID=A0A426WVD8_ENSVE|nr:hypothetical protein B296_00054205 [Ensete ventricosum]
MGSRTSTLSQKNTTVINFARSHARVEFLSVFRAPSQKFKILAIHDVLVHGKSYKHGFTKKRNGYKLCAESSFDRFFVHRLENSKTGLSCLICPWEVVQARFRKKIRRS